MFFVNETLVNDEFLLVRWNLKPYFLFSNERPSIDSFF